MAIIVLVRGRCTPNRCRPTTRYRPVKVVFSSEIDSCDSATLRNASAKR
jgi:hypothetical protein